MISALSFVPAGVADKNPKRYELSTTERELLAAMEEQEEEQQQQSGEASKDNANPKSAKEKRKRGTFKVNLPDTPPATSTSDLPADLRMDEYSDDDEDDAGGAIGQLLMDQPATMAAEYMAQQEGEEDEDDDDDDNNNKQATLQMADPDSDDDDEDDDLADVPDTREFTPVNVDGLDAMRLYDVGMGAGADMEDMDFDEDDSEAEDVKLSDDDALILVTKTEDVRDCIYTLERRSTHQFLSPHPIYSHFFWFHLVYILQDFSALEVHVYDQKRGTLYVHHDIPLPSFPICLAHGQVSPEGTAGNYCAVGTFDTGIEVWNLDVLNALEPSCILGGEDTSAADEMMKRQMMGAGGSKNMTKMDMKGIGSGSLKPGSHTEAVMTLSWNPIHKQVLASGSADTTVKLWDVTQASDPSKCNAATFNHHRGKVQSVVWHPKEGTLLATGSYDKRVSLVDARSSGADSRSVKIQADCEVVAWDPFHPENLVVGTEDGQLTCWDVRKFDTATPLWTAVGNEFGGITDLSFSPHVPGLFATCAVDKTVTLWDSYHNGGPAEGLAPRPCGSKDMCAGKLYSIDFYQSKPLLLACGGSGNMLSIWNLENEAAIKRNFSDRMESLGENAEFTDENEPKREDFEAMMAEREKPVIAEPEKSKKKKSKGRKGKKKAHKRGS